MGTLGNRRFETIPYRTNCIVAVAVILAQANEELAGQLVPLLPHTTQHMAQPGQRVYTQEKRARLPR